MFFSSAVQVARDTYRTVGTSRAVALATTAPTLEQAHERVVERAGSVGVLQWRRDVGDERYLQGLSRLCAASLGLTRQVRARMAAVIVETSMHPQFLSNTYLVADGEGGPAFFVDAGGPVEPLIEAAERLGLTPTHVLLTHHHFDHVCEVGALRERWPRARGADQPARARAARAAPRRAAATARRMGTVEAGETLRFGTLEVRPLHTPGHTAGMLSFLVGDAPSAARRAAAAAARASAAPGGFTGGEAVVFTGDTLFKDSVGGVQSARATRPTPTCATRSWAR